jgi:hypothetical protein
MKDCRRERHRRAAATQSGDGSRVSPGARGGEAQARP